MKNAVIYLFAFFLLSSFNESNTPAGFTLKGRVDDESGQTIAGATITIKGTNQGTTSDVNGEFILKTTKKCETLLVAYIGYESQEIKKACDGDFIIITLIPDKTELQEVVVAYGKRQKASGNVMFRTDGMMAPSYMPAMARREENPPYNTEDYDVINENRFFGARQNPISTFSIDVDAASYSNLRRFIQNGQVPPADAVRIEEMVNYFDYDYKAPKGDEPFEVVTEMATAPWNDHHKLLLIGLQGKKMPVENLPPSNLVFLIDVSGSMHDYNKLPLVKSSLRMLVNQIREIDKVALVVYAGAAGTVLPSTPGSEKQKIIEAIDKLEAGGSTAGSAGIKLAYQIARENFAKQGNNRVILCTDGDFNVGTSSDAELVRLIEKERESRVFLTVLGFGMGNYKDNKMQKLADAGNGNHYYIDNISEGKKVLVNEFSGTLFTIAKDVKIQVEFNPAKIQGYRLIGYENRMLNKEDFNDDKKDAGELGSGHRVTALYEIIPAGVKTDLLGDVDELKYQNSGQLSGKSDDLLTIKLRYKKPDGDKSMLIERAVSGERNQQETSDNFRLAASVAEFGMLLRNSEFKGNASYAHAFNLAKSALGKDESGYRSELLRMIGTMRDLADPDVTKK
jgi:Ca-activated chloride channel family protein